MIETRLEARIIALDPGLRAVLSEWISESAVQAALSAAARDADPDFARLGYGCRVEIVDEGRTRFFCPHGSHAADCPDKLDSIPTRQAIDVTAAVPVPPELLAYFREELRR